MAIVKVNTIPPKIVHVKGLFPKQPTAISDITGLQDALEDIVNSFYSKEVIDQEKILPLIQALTQKAGLESNTFSGEQVIARDGLTLSLGNFRPMKFQNIVGTNYIMFNCYIFQDEDSGEFLFRQVSSGKSSYIAFGDSGIQVGRTNTDAAANTIVYPTIQFEIQSNGAIDVKRDEIVLSEDQEYQQEYHSRYLVILDASAHAVTYYLSPDIVKGLTCEIYCKDSTYGCILNGSIITKNDPLTALSSINLYAGDSVRLFSNGTTFRQL